LQLTAHELAHVLFLNLSAKEEKTYRKSLGWDKNPDGTSKRAGKFVDQDGQDSVEEDFANNIESFLFEPERLKSVTPAAHEWILKHLSKDFGLKKDCADEKKQ